MGDTGCEQGPKSRRIQAADGGRSTNVATLSIAGHCEYLGQPQRCTSADDDVARIVAAWPSLPEEIKSHVLAMIEEEVGPLVAVRPDRVSVRQSAMQIP
jgi:hypothetical protein